MVWTNALHESAMHPHNVWNVPHLGHENDALHLITGFAATAHTNTLLLLVTKYSGFGGQYHDSSSPEHRYACYWLCRTAACIVVSSLIPSTWVEPNPRYDSKCEYIFGYLYARSDSLFDKVCHLGGQYLSGVPRYGLACAKVRPMRCVHITLVSV